MKILFFAFCQTGLTEHAVTRQVVALAAEGFQIKICVISSVIGYSRPFLFTGCGYNQQGCYLLSDRQTCCLMVHAVTKLDAVLAAQGYKNFKHNFSSVIGYWNPLKYLLITGSG